MNALQLRVLCDDRPLQTPEIHATNDFYGHAAQLKRYVGWPAARSTKTAIEHGVMLNDLIWDLDLRTRCPIFLCAAPTHADRYMAQASGGRRAVAIGPLIRYVEPARIDFPRGRTLVAFPTHSTHRVRTRFDVDLFVRRLNVLRASFDLVRVCVYWRDVLLGLGEELEARGFECVSAGHIYDPEFLPRLAGILRGAAAVFTNEVGSHVLYATLLDRPVVIQRQDVDYEAASKDIVRTDTPDFVEHPNVVRLVELFSTLAESVTDEQRRFVDDLCGTSCLRSPAELRSILADAERHYRDRTSFPRRAVHRMRHELYYQLFGRARRDRL